VGAERSSGTGRGAARRIVPEVDRRWLLRASLVALIAVALVLFVRVTGRAFDGGMRGARVERAVDAGAEQAADATGPSHTPAATR